MKNSTKHFKSTLWMETLRKQPHQTAGEKSTMTEKIPGKTTELKTIPGDQTILSQKWIVTMMNFLKSLEVFRHILLDYLTPMLNPLVTNTLGKSWKASIPKTFALGKLSPDNPILEEMVNAIPPAILRTTIPITIVLNATDPFSRE